MNSYLPLEEPCKSAIEKEYCTGCNRLELENFVAYKECKYATKPTAQDYIEQIRINLGGKK